LPVRDLHYCCWATWSPGRFGAIRYLFFAKHYRVIAPEYRNHELHDATALDAFAADVPDLLQALGYQRALLVGHSIGAMVLARLLETTPQVAQAVVLANGFLRLRLLPEMLHWLQPQLVPLVRIIYPRLPWLARQLGSYALLWGDEHIFSTVSLTAKSEKCLRLYTNAGYLDGTASSGSARIPSASGFEAGNDAGTGFFQWCGSVGTFSRRTPT
jgi:pimeloyl-ACP methyl ester carboxylesterase